MSDTIKVIVITAAAAGAIVMDRVGMIGMIGRVRYETVKDFIQPLTTPTSMKRIVLTWASIFIGVAGLARLLSLETRPTIKPATITPHAIIVEQSDILRDNFMKTANERIYICEGNSHNCHILLRE